MSRMPGLGSGSGSRGGGDGPSGCAAGRRRRHWHVQEGRQFEQQIAALVLILRQIGGDDRDRYLGHVAGQDAPPAVIYDAPRGGVLFHAETVDVGRLLIIVAPDHLQPQKLHDQRQKGDGDEHAVHEQSEFYARWLWVGQPTTPSLRDQIGCRTSAWSKRPAVSGPRSARPKAE